MSLEIVSASERRRTMTVKAQIWGPAGVGKTTLLKTLDPDTTLAVCPEGGLMAVQTDDEFGPAFDGDSQEPTNWAEHMYLLDMFRRSPRPPKLAKYKTVFLDSTSIIGKHSFDFAKTQPEAFSEKAKNPDGTPKENLMGAFGLHGRQMIDWAWGWKQIPDINVILIGGLHMKDVNGVQQWTPLIPGGQAVDHFPFIFDFSFVMNRQLMSDGRYVTGLYTDPIKYPEYASVPIKTRTRALAPFERPHLNLLMSKALGRPILKTVPVAQPASIPTGTATTPEIQASEVA